MAEIRLAVEGEDAVGATEALLAIPGISGNYTITDTTEKEAVAATVATIVGIVGGSIAIAEQIRKWYQEYKQKPSGKRIEKVLIIGRNGQRVILEDATVEQIRQILEA